MESSGEDLLVFHHSSRINQISLIVNMVRSLILQVVAQKLKEAEITEDDSLLLVKSIVNPCGDESDDLHVEGVVNLGEDLPTDYEPPFFRSCSEQEANNHWTRNPLKMDVGGVNSKHLILANKVNHASQDHFVVAPVGEVYSSGVKMHGCPYCAPPHEKRDSWRSTKDPPSPECQCTDEQKANRKDAASSMEIRKKEMGMKAVEKRRMDGRYKIEVKLFYVDSSFESDQQDSSVITLLRVELHGMDFEEFGDHLKHEMNQTITPPTVVKQRLCVSFKDAENRCYSLNETSWEEFKRRGINAVAELRINRDFRRPFLHGPLAYRGMMFWANANKRNTLITGVGEIEGGLVNKSIKLLYLNYCCPLREISDMIRLAQVAKDLKIPFVFNRNTKMDAICYGVSSASGYETQLKKVLEDCDTLRSQQGDIWRDPPSRFATVNSAGITSTFATPSGSSSDAAVDNIDAVVNDDVQR